jgi:predicted short-subunit dehydrogenase-like oxidoreductase (DUF2520 family)
MIKTVSIIGVGRVGGALALALPNFKYIVQNLVIRNGKTFDLCKVNILNESEFDKISTDIVFITTQDSEIEIVAKKLAKIVKNKPYVFHTSGSLSSEILSSLKEKGCKIASLHPLVSISEAKIGKARFAGSYFCLEGDEEAVSVGKAIVKDLQGVAFSINTKNKPLYHASAVMACGHLVALFSIAIDMLSQCGLSAENSKKVLLPLVKSSVENLQIQTLKNSLTGTFARGDVEILQKHIKSISENLPPEILDIYLKLGEKSLKLSKADKEKIAEMKKEIVNAKNQMLR